MAVMTSVGFEKGEGVSVYALGDWRKGIVTDVDPKSGRLVKVQFNANGISDEDWFKPDSVRSR